MNKKFKIFVSEIKVNNSEDLFGTFNSNLNNLVNECFETFKTFVEKNEEDVPFVTLVSELAERLVPVAQNFEAVYPLFDCETVDEVKAVLSEFVPVPTNLGGELSCPAVIDYLSGGKSFTVMTKKEFQEKSKQISLPIMGIVNGVPVKNEFSKLSVNDLQRDMRIVTETDNMISTDPMEIYVYVVELS